LEAGAVKEMVTLALPAIAVTAVGAPGTDVKADEDVAATTLPEHPLRSTPTAAKIRPDINIRARRTAAGVK
jgi:hypothetical protein